MAGFFRPLGVAAALLLAAALPAAAQEPPLTFAGPPNRYQAIAVGDSVFVIDTATGRCWSKHLDEPKWHDEGNPAEEFEPERRPAGRKPVLSLADDEPAEVTVRQRGRAAVPGSDGTLFLHLGDISEGRVLVSVRDSRGGTVAGEKSLAQGQALPFDLDGQAYSVAVQDLTNLLTGDDFAVLKVAKAPPAAEDERPQPEAAAPKQRHDDAERSPEAGAADAPRRDPPPAARPEEDRKIEALIERVEGMNGATFVRNGAEYDGRAAAA